MSDFSWPNGAACAITLCYDDSKPVHYNLVGPTLEKNGLRGTFYATITSDPLDHPEKWRELASRGHELGNHTLFHPCRFPPGGKLEWLDRGYNMSDYTLKRFEDEIRVTNLVLNLLDGKTERTFGNTCGHCTVGTGAEEVSIDEICGRHFVAVRGSKRGAADPKKGIDLMQFGSITGDGRRFAEIKPEIEKIRQTGAWGTYLFHGVGGDSHKLYVDAGEHEQLAEWLGKQKDIWTAPAVEIARHIRAWQSRK